MPSPEMQRIIHSLRRRQSDRGDGTTRTLAEIRAAFAPVGQLLPLPDDVVVTSLGAGGVRVHWLDQPAAEPDNLMFFIHGGGYSLGALRSHGPLAARLGRETKRRVMFVEYRLAPEHPYPAAINDVLTAWSWLATQRSVHLASALVAGDSAGGGLALRLLQILRDRRQALPAGAILISPWVDLTCSGASMIDRAAQDPIFDRAKMQTLVSQYLNGVDPREPVASPLFGSHAGLPPMLVQVGGAEVLLSDSVRLASAAADDGVDVALDVADDLPHVYHGALGTPETMAAMHRIADWADSLPASTKR